MADHEHVHPGSRAEWRAWLAANHAQGESIWFVYGKMGSGAARLDPDAAIEEALCFGWIDSLPRKVDETRAKLRFSPRKAGSNWSALNKRRVAAMIEAGRMTPAGLAKIEAARADGSWTALEEVDALIVPDDLARAFARHPGSAAAFAGFPGSTRRGILEWILNAKRPETRAKRLEETASLAAKGERANQFGASASASAAWRRRAARPSPR